VYNLSYSEEVRKMMKQKIRSFVLRAGRISPRQQQALEQGLAHYELPMQDTPWSISDIFGREADTVVEIGFGMGASLLTMARARPEINFIGIEVHRAGIGSLVADLQEEGLSNVRIAPFDACEVFRTCLPDQSLAGVQIFFPDPWPKKRHHKRRLIQPEFVQTLLKKIKKGGFIHCATDWEAYAEQIYQVLSNNPELSNQNPQGGFSERPMHRPLTKFEQRGIHLGHAVFDAIFMIK
jgi:tRNA (guanine-N7-)-methyltransferase